MVGSRRSSRRGIHPARFEPGGAAHSPHDGGTGGAAAVPFLADRRQQEDVVVHARPEQDREHRRGYGGDDEAGSPALSSRCLNERMQDTPGRLRDAAERLLAERAAARISLRDITEAAGANVASVGYHFGSKDALLDEVVRHALTEGYEQQRARLSQLPDDAGLDEIVRAWVFPTFTAQADERDERSRRRSQVLRNALTGPSPAVAALLAEMAAPVQQQLLDRIARHVPYVSSDELWVRHTAVLAALGALGSGVFASMLDGVDPPVLADQLVAWIVGGLTAEPAGTTAVAGDS
jgi:AcrR family transcriptional regulator